MLVRVRFASRVTLCTAVLMAFIVHMWMGVHLRVMNMLVLMSFGCMQPNPQRHEDAGDNRLCRKRFIERGQSYGSPEKWSH